MDKPYHEFWLELKQGRLKQVEYKLNRFNPQRSYLRVTRRGEKESYRVWLPQEPSQALVQECLMRNTEFKVVKSSTLSDWIRFSSWKWAKFLTFGFIASFFLLVGLNLLLVNLFHSLSKVPNLGQNLTKSLFNFPTQVDDGLNGEGMKAMEESSLISEDTLSLDELVLDEKTKQPLKEFVVLLEYMDYLPEGLSIPRGILMSGLPGTGKTAAAKAVAKELKASFIALTGNDLSDQMWKGSGAKKIREIFKYASQKPCCVLFIDEIDSVGLRRSSGRNSTALNQLLHELDGFKPRDKVFVLASTNLYGALDPALLRPGRFDKVIQFNCPNRSQRLKILQLHIKRAKVNLDPSVDLVRIASICYSKSGADLKTLVNEAAHLALRRGASQVSEKDFDEAHHLMLLNNRREREDQTTEEKEVTAYHEAGHALVGACLNTKGEARFPYKGSVSILPGAEFDGITVYNDLPEDVLHYGSLDLIKQLTARDLAGGEGERFFHKGRGRTEEEINAKKSFGVASDYEKAFDHAKLSVAFSLEGNYPEFYGIKGKDLQFLYSPETTRKLSGAVTEFMQTMQEETRKLLEANEEALTALAQLLLEKETLYEEDLQAFYETHPLILTPFFSS